jgi:hypothetical protein
MHPILQRIKDNAKASAQRMALAAELRPASANAKRSAAWADLRIDLRAALGRFGSEEADFLLSKLAPEEPPERFNSLIDHHVCVLAVEGHAPLQVLMVRQQGRWRPAGPGRIVAWVLGGTWFADLGVALVKAQEEYERDPAFYDRMREAHTFDPEPVPVSELPAGATVDDMAAALSQGGMQEMTALPGGMRPIPEAVPIESEPDTDHPDWQGTRELDPQRPSRKRKGGPQQ